MCGHKPVFLSGAVAKLKFWVVLRDRGGLGRCASGGRTENCLSQDAEESNDRRNGSSDTLLVVTSTAIVSSAK